MQTPCRLPKKGRNLAKPAKNNESLTPPQGIGCLTLVRRSAQNGEPVSRGTSQKPLARFNTSGTISCPQQPPPNQRQPLTPQPNPPTRTPRQANSNAPPPTDSAPRWPPFASPSRGWAFVRPSPRSSARRQPERSMPTANCSRPDDANWTGAEIKSCCRLASLLDVPLVQAAQNVVPVAVTAGDKIAGLRQWASGRCLSADRAGVYSRAEGGSGGRVRRVVRAD